MAFSEKPSPETLDRLCAFLESADRPEDTLSYNELLGFLYTITCSPEMIPPGDWMLMIFANEEAGFYDAEEANLITEAIMALYGQCNQQVLDGNPAMPPSCAPASQAMDNFCDGAPLAQWAKGFLIGHTYLEDVWGNLIQGEWEDELVSCLMVLSFFADIRLAEAYNEEVMTGESSIAQLAESVLRMFDDAMASYAHMGRALYIAMLASDEKEQVATEYVAQGEPCPCGSGKLFSQCCGMPKTVH
ncbi:MAG: UPF0149 family protein [Candidatus Polarisedimenticolaceae bacterium]|nr:UPF0149 family protein [Candidatus Polarisedimenticolaceae bacterium]